MAKPPNRILYLGNDHRIHLSEQEYQRLRSLVAFEGLTPEAWLQRDLRRPSPTARNGHREPGGLPARGLLRAKQGRPSAPA